MYGLAIKKTSTSQIWVLHSLTLTSLFPLVFDSPLKVFLPILGRIIKKFSNESDILADFFVFSSDKIELRGFPLRNHPDILEII